jgi:hypothetical protein
MPLADDPDAFETAFRTAVAAVLPSATIERTARTVIAVKLRVALGENHFVDVFFNSRNGRMDLAVVEGGERVFGYDNLGGWHRHPLNAPEQHELCEEPSLESFVREAVSVARRG